MIASRKSRLRKLESLAAPRRRRRLFVEHPERITETTEAGSVPRTRAELEAAAADPATDLLHIRVIYEDRPHTSEGI